MSLIQVEDLVSYQLRTSYLSEVADGVGERLITLNDKFLNTAPFKAAGWRTNSALLKRTHSPPIPTAIASEYFQAPPRSGLTLEDDVEEGGMLTGTGWETPGPGVATRRRRERRREREMEEDDSSDLSDESDDESDQRAAQQIRFAKMPLRNRSGSSPIQSSTLRQNAATSSPRPAPGARRGSQSALETVKERARRDTVTSSEVSSDNEFDNSGYRKHKEAARTAAKTARLQARIAEEPSQAVNRIRSEPLAEEEDDSDLSDASSFVESVDSASILADVENTALPASPGQQVVGTPPKQLLRQATVRRPPTHPQPSLQLALPPPRPMSTIRPLSMVQPRSLLSDAFKAKNKKPAMPFEKFASLSGQGDPDPLSIRIYAPFSKTSSKPFEVPIRKNIQDEDGSFRAVTVAELIGLSLWRYHEEKMEPPIPNDKLNVNWWTLRMVDGDEVDDDFPPLERKKPVSSFTTANNRAARSRGNSKMFDDFGLVQASEDGFEENQNLTPQFDQQEVAEETTDEHEMTPKNTPQLQTPLVVPSGPRPNPIINTTFRVETAHADKPATPAPAAVPASRGQQKLLRIHIMSSDVAPGQMVTLDVTTDTYLAEVLDMVCKKRQLDKSTHVLKLPGTGSVVYVDRAVSSIGNVTDLELHRRRFATDGPLTITGSPIGSSPKQHVWDTAIALQKKKKDKAAPHPLAREAVKFDEVGSSDVSLKRYVVWKKQTMRFVGNERLLTIDGEYVYIQPSSSGKPTRESGKTTSVHFSNILNCSTSRKHPGTFKLYVFRDNAPKRTDYEAKSAHEAAEIVAEIKKGFAPYNKD
ncbi:putative Stress-activated map kinase interacting protein 1-domain-containing protein [Seiridium cardinale]|uniref:Stress-activated map kinase interacting protein 1-domain-containing protein n=1 Tax=Seiridium cardinale TaxID=138064 RepID=A0ABR2XMP0_9PEZI